MELAIGRIFCFRVTGRGGQVRLGWQLRLLLDRTCWLHRVSLGARPTRISEDTLFQRSCCLRVLAAVLALRHSVDAVLVLLIVLFLLGIDLCQDFVFACSMLPHVLGLGHSLPVFDDIGRVCDVGF